MTENCGNNTEKGELMRKKPMNTHLFVIEKGKNNVGKEPNWPKRKLSFDVR